MKLSLVSITCRAEIAPEQGNLESDGGASIGPTSTDDEEEPLPPSGCTGSSSPAGDSGGAQKDIRAVAAP